MAELGKILIADDEETFLHSTADLLRREGYQCACALDAKTATEKLHAEDYDLLISDIKMPGNPELELIKNLGNIIKGIPVILVTGYPSVHSAIQSIQLPVVAYLVKPLDFSELLRCVQLSVENYRIYKAICSTRKLFQKWAEDLEKLKALMCQQSTDISYMTVGAFFDLTILNIGNTLLDLKHLIEAAALDEDKQSVCHMLECPRLNVLTGVLKEAICVLEKTKGSFKSKDLGELRRKLEEIVNLEKIK